MTALIAAGAALGGGALTGVFLLAVAERQSAGGRAVHYGSD